MNFEACFRFLAERLKEEIIVTSAGQQLGIVVGHHA
jgi:hypothetical protein